MTVQTSQPRASSKLSLPCHLETDDCPRDSRAASTDIAVSELLRHSIQSPASSSPQWRDTPPKGVNPSRLRRVASGTRKFGWIDQVRGSVPRNDSIESSMSEYGWFEFRSEEPDGINTALEALMQGNPGRGGKRAGSPVPLQRSLPRDSLDRLQEQTLMRMGLGPEAEGSGYLNHRCQPVEYGGAEGVRHEGPECCAGPPPEKGAGSRVLRHIKNEEHFIVATRSFSDLGDAAPEDEIEEPDFADSIQSPPPLPRRRGGPESQRGEHPERGRLACACAIAAFRIVGGPTGQHAEYQVVLTRGLNVLSAWKRYRDFVSLSGQLRDSGLPNAETAWENVQRARRWFRCLDEDYIRAKSISLSIFLGQVLFEIESPALLVAFLQESSRVTTP